MARLERDSRLLYYVAEAWLISLLAGCGDVERHARTVDAEPGKARFENYCAACHQHPSPQTEGGVPPLEGSPWVAGPETRLIRIVLHGLRGPIEIGGQTYDLEMPGFGQPFTDEQIAAVLSFVRRRYGGPSPPITAARVSRVRAETQNRTDYWTVDELLKIP